MIKARICLDQPGLEVFELGHLHLELAGAGPGVLGEDVQDELGAVQDFKFLIVAWQKGGGRANLAMKLWALQNFQAPVESTIQAIASLEDGQGIPRLIEISRTLPPADRATILFGLSGHIQNPAVKAEIIAALDDKSNPVKLAAITLVGQNKLPEAAPKLAAIAAGGNPDLSIAARTSLFRIGGPEAAAEAKKIAALPVPEAAEIPEAEKIRYVATVLPALEALARFETAAALPSLRRLARFGLFPVAEQASNKKLMLQDLPISSARAMRESIDLLRRIKANDKETVEVLKAIYLDPRRVYLRQAAERALSHMEVEIPDIKKHEEELFIAERRKQQAAIQDKTAPAAAAKEATSKETPKP